jgi:predicted ester cyclase
VGLLPRQPAGIRAIAEEWTTAFPDWRFDLRTLVADGDLGAAHMPCAGTFERPLYGLPPTREVYDEAGMWRQLGVSSPA